MATKKKADGPSAKDIGVLVCQDVGGPILDLALALQNAGAEIPEGATMDDIIMAAIAHIKGGSTSDDSSGGGEMEESAASLLAALGVKDFDQALVAVKRNKESAKEVDALSQKIAAMEDREQERKIAAKIEEYVTANKINPNDESQLALSKKMASKDFESWVEFMDGQPAIIPVGRKVSKADPGDSREKVIASAASDYKVQPAMLQRITSERAWINNALREAGFDRMTDKDTNGSATN